LKAKIEIERELQGAGLQKLIGMGKGMVEWVRVREWVREWVRERVREWLNE
jgi:hypothetical protein